MSDLRSCLFGLLALGFWFVSPATGDLVPQARSVVRVDPRSGRLVRVVLPPQAGTTGRGGPAVELMRSVARAAAEAHGVDPDLVHSVIEVESNYNPWAVSPKGAEGLMQLMPSTARRFGVTNSFDPSQNILGGVRYLRYLLELFGDPHLALAAYNAGEEAVLRYGGIPPFPETREYVRKVSKLYHSRRQAKASQTVLEASPAAEARPVSWTVDSDGNLVLFTR